MPSIIDPSRSSELGMIARSPTVANAMASSVSVRTVAAWVPVGIVTTAAWGDDIQNVTRVRAAVGGYRLTPMSSRNLT